MTFKEFLELVARFVWPVVLIASGFLFQSTQANKENLYEFRLYVAENYTSKEDLQTMFSQLETNIDKRLETLIKTLKQ